MFFVLFILAVLGALAGGLAVMWESEIRTRTSDRDGLIAFYLAQAGIERAKIRTLSGVGSSWMETDLSDLDVGGDSYLFRYDISGTDIGSGNYMLQGIGRVLNLAGTQEFARREIQVIVNGITDAPPPDGLDDDMTGSPQAWSWREI